MGTGALDEMRWRDRGCWHSMCSQPQEPWTHWDLNPGPSACEADVIPLHHVPLRQDDERFVLWFENKENRQLDQAWPLKESIFCDAARQKLQARLAQSAERKALNLVVVGSSPTVGVIASCQTKKIQ